MPDTSAVTTADIIASVVASINARQVFEAPREARTRDFLEKILTH